MIEYELISDFRNNKRLNNDFLNLVKKKNLKSSYISWLIRLGKYDEHCTPYALINAETNSILATIGVVRMHVHVDQVRYSAIQLVSLLVHDDYLETELDQILIKKLLNRFENIVDIIFSYDPEINKFLIAEPGFVSYGDYRWWTKWTALPGHRDTIATRLDTTSSREMKALTDQIHHTTRISPLLATTNDASIKIYNILKYFSRDVYFLPEKEVYVVFTIEGTVFKLISVYSHNKIDWQELLEILIPPYITEIEFGFIPPEGVVGLQCTTDDCRPATPFGSPAVEMVSKVIAGGLKRFDKPFYFPLLSRAK